MNYSVKGLSKYHEIGWHCLLFSIFPLWINGNFKEPKLLCNGKKKTIYVETNPALQGFGFIHTKKLNWEIDVWIFVANSAICLPWQPINWEVCTNSHYCLLRELSHDMTKPTKWLCAQQRLRSAWASAQSDQSSLCTQWVAKDPSFRHADRGNALADLSLRWAHTHFVGFVMSQLRWLLMGHFCKSFGKIWFLCRPSSFWAVPHAFILFMVFLYCFHVYVLLFLLLKWLSIFRVRFCCACAVNISVSWSPGLPASVLASMIVFFIPCCSHFLAFIYAGVLVLVLAICLPCWAYFNVCAVLIASVLFSIFASLSVLFLS